MGCIEICWSKVREGQAVCECITNGKKQKGQACQVQGDHANELVRVGAITPMNWYAWGRSRQLTGTRSSLPIKLAKYKSACLCTIQHPINELVSVLELFVKVSDTTLH
jgi:hypothetical protein